MKAHSDTSAGSGDASEDSEWGPDSEEECSCSNEIQTSDSEVDEDPNTVATSINLNDGGLRELVTRLIQEDPCNKKCLKGKAMELEQFLCSLSQMTSGEKKQSIIMTLVVLKKDGYRAASSGSWPTKRINDGIFSVKAHGNLLNQKASAVDLRWLVSWFKRFAVSVGDVVSVRVRRKETKEGEIKMYYSNAEYTLLPAYFTWDQLYTKMHNYVEEIALRVREPRSSTFRQYLTKLCSTIRIRSPRSNMCDVCTIYWSRMKSGATVTETEAFGEHTTAARRMREEYKSDLASADDTQAVIIIDFSQNLTLPSVSNTPSQWYFLSLRNVNMFGVFYANKNIQYNYGYDESVAGKGADEVNSMLHHFISQIVVPAGFRKLTIYADNCGGQNKNNFVVRMLLTLGTYVAFG
ncbi:hypothetical protein F444_16474 [Phytophthora nicotianae P1976]|uniref:Uncharacterized protein n=1 Tax=Phytophthora nicotianae P1976 TaxID=1317066 RepID=A0A080ZI84_PHYNI|nr:hypothetical protein F444_16474 [Phytophthora nicotianae P1976]